MNATARKALWERLRGAGLVAGEVPAAPSSPWFVRAMLGIAGWIGAMFLLGFVGIVFVIAMKNAVAGTIAAVACCGGAWAIFRRGGGVFADQFGLAIGLVGQSLFATAIFQMCSGSSFAAYLLLFLVEVGLTVLMPNFVHRFFTTLGAVTALALALAQVGLLPLMLPLTAVACALVWRREGKLTPVGFWPPVGYGLALGVFQSAAMPLIGGVFSRQGGAGWLHRHGTEIGTAAVTVVLLGVAIDILRQLEIDLRSREGIAILLCTLLLLGISFPAPGLAAAALLLILGFAGGNRVLFGLGTLAVLSFLGHYYYRMEETLLFKSLILAATGALLLLLRGALRRIFPAQEAGGHA